ncbi:uncharacterized protein [Rutidosis leptorrhynchoides]|uniref:uncharacterized protein n=1 Tax=Rutidosis leptorrhynchoides TaxID=125765 RepID=UPI003A99885C
MATEGGVSDHPIINEEVKEEVKAVETKPTEEVKIEEPPCVTKETTGENKFEPVTVEEVKKVDEEVTPTSEVIVADKVIELPEVAVEETSKTEDMAMDTDTKVPVVEVEEKKTETVKLEPLTEVPAVKEDEKITETVKVEKEKITDEISVPAVDLEKTEEKKEETDTKSAVVEDVKKEPEVVPEVVKCSDTKEVEPIVSVQEASTEINKKEDLKQELAEKVVEIADKNLDEQVVVKEPEVTEDNKSVPADEITIKNKDEPKGECAKETVETKEIPDKEFETIKIEEVVTDVKKDEEKAEEKKDSSTNKTVENGTQESTKEEGPEKPALEPVKTESKEEKTSEETKSTPKEEDKTTPKSGGGLMGKVKKSFFKAKKAITGKNNTATATASKPAETKEDEKA